MAKGCSLEALQWLMYEQELNPILQLGSGEHISLEHAYFRGEKQFGAYTIDGYAEIDGKHVFWEYLGCYFHKNCPFVGCQYHGTGSDERWIQKEAFLRSNGTLITMRGCMWAAMKRRSGLKHFPTPDFPQIMTTFSTQTAIIDGIKNDELFGYVVCDVSTPDDVYDSIKWINFPPLISKQLITEDMVSPYMLTRCKDRDYKLPQETLVQTYNVKQSLLYTPLIKFYISIGLEVSNVSQFIQFRPAKVLSDFVGKITDGRIQAKKKSNPSLELAYKIIGNRYIIYYF